MTFSAEIIAAIDLAYAVQRALRRAHDWGER
jgi:hypothetical protein